MRSIAFLYASEGTGHKAAAENLKEWFLESGSENTAMCLDVLEVLPLWLHETVSKGYLLIARHVPWIWGRFYWGSDKLSIQASIFDHIHSLLCSIYLPEIEDIVFILEKLVAQEADSVQALGKRLGNLFNLARRLGQV